GERRDVHGGAAPFAHGVPGLMLRDALFLARMDARYLLTRRETILWTFVMPLIFFYFIGTITKNAGGGGDNRDPIAGSVPADAGFLAGQVIDRLKAANYRVVRTETRQEFEEFRTRLEIPAGFTGAVLAGKPQKIRLTRTGRSEEHTSELQSLTNLV